MGVWIERNWLQLGIGLVCLWGSFLPGTGLYLADYLSWMIAAIMLMMGAGIGFKRLAGRMGAWQQNLLVIFITYGISSVAAWAMGNLFFTGTGPVFIGLILVGTTCTTISTSIVFTRLSGGDEALALWMSVSSSFLCALIQPYMLTLFAGQDLQIPALMLIRRLFMLLIVPLIAGMFLRTALGEKRVSPYGNFLTRACSLIILAVIMVAVSGGRDLLGSPDSLPILAAVAALHIFLAVTGYLFSLFFGFSRKDRIAIVFCGSQKTLQVPVYLAMQVLDEPGAALAPVLFHVFQLIVDAFMIQRFAKGEKHK